MGTNAKRKKRWWKKVVFILIALCIIAIPISVRIVKGGKPKPIATSKVIIGTVIEKVTETGNIELLRTVEVKSKIAGTVKEILAKEGERVKRGQVLCVIDPDPSQTLILFQKRSSVAQSQIRLSQAEKELERKRELAKTALISTKDLEDAENNYLIAQNNFSLSKQELEIMEREIETTGSGAEEKIVSSKVHAPYDGYITRRYVEEGTIVTSGISSIVAGTNVFQIGDPSTQIIKTNISEVDIGKVFVGADVNILLDAYPDTTFAGRIRHISPVGSLLEGRNVITFKTEVEIIDKDSRLKPGMSCDVDIIISKADSIRYLSLEAVYEKKQGSKEDKTETSENVVYVKKKSDNPGSHKFWLFSKKPDPLDDFIEKKVTIGIKSENRVQIVSDIDTTTEVTTDAEKFFNELDKRDKAKKEKEKKEQNKKAKSQQTIKKPSN